MNDSFTPRTTATTAADRRRDGEIIEPAAVHNDDHDDDNERFLAVPEQVQPLLAPLPGAAAAPPPETEVPPPLNNDLTNTSSSTLLSTHMNAPAHDDDRPNFNVGDHVYQWQSACLIPHVYQHHGIVLDVRYESNQWMVQIADFSHYWQPPSSSLETAPLEDGPEHTAALPASPPQIPQKTMCKSLSLSTTTQHGCLRTFSVPQPELASWHTVLYEASVWRQHVWSRGGTCTASRGDAPGLVRARVQFLLQHAHLLPPYHAVQANCECVAVWCKTGTWCTLQASSWLHMTAAGQAKSAMTLAGAASTTQVTVPAAGLWGWLGYTTHVSLATTQPLLLPAIGIYGVVTVGLPALWLWQAKRRWHGWTETLNTAFWAQACDHPDVFVDCITHWANVAASGTKGDGADNCRGS